MKLSEAEFWRRSACRGAGIGALFLGLFGSAWLFIGLATLPRQFWWLYLVLSAAPLCVLWSAVQRLRDTSGALPEEYKPLKKKIGRRLGLINAAQWTAIGISVGILMNIGRGDLIVPAIVIIVALHFIPLGRVFRDPLYYRVCPVMLVWLVICYRIAFSSVGIRLSAEAIGTGAILWAAAALGLWQTRRLPRGFAA